LVLVGRSRMGLGLLRVSLELAEQLGDPTAQIRPLNNLVSFLATRDLRGARSYAEQGLAVVRRAGDREWGLTLTASAAHVYWLAGDWEATLAFAGDLDYENENGPVLDLLTAYAAAIREARAMPSYIPEIQDLPTGMRTDILLVAGRALLASFVARAEGDIAAAAEQSETAIREYVSTSGVDDDFPLFWLTALDDRLAIGDTEGARRLCGLVSEAPRGSVPPLVRSMLPWLQGRVAGLDDEAGPLLANGVDALRDFGAVFFLGRALTDEAAWLRARNDDAAAAPLLTEAAGVFESLGAKAWLSRIEEAELGVTQVAPAGT
jgi:hypothetical protein